MNGLYLVQSIKDGNSGMSDVYTGYRTEPSIHPALPLEKEELNDIKLI